MGSPTVPLQNPAGRHRCVIDSEECRAVGAGILGLPALTDIVPRYAATEKNTENMVLSSAHQVDLLLMDALANVIS